MSNPWDTVSSLVRSGDAQSLVGIEESQFFEAKGVEPYDLKSKGGKMELAKDVSAFANASGGVIVIGLKTERDVHTKTDKVADTQQLSLSAFDADAYLRALKYSMYPVPDGIEVDWFPSTANADVGLGMITVPNQDEGSKPFIIVNGVDGQEELKGFFAGFATRRGEDNEPHTAHQLRALVARGMDSARLRLIRVEEKLDKFLESATSPAKRLPVGSEFLKERCDDIVRGMDEHLYVVAIAPNSPTVVERMFDGGANTPTWLLENPPSVRSGGWDLVTRAEAEITHGEYLEVRQGEAKVIRLFGDGTLICRLVAGSRGLAWAQGGDKLNTVALIESNTNIARLYERIRSEFFKPAPSSFKLRVGFLNADTSAPIKLPPHGVDSFGWKFPEDAKSITVSPVWRERDYSDAEATLPDHVGFLISALAFRCFGFRENQVPYTTDVSGRLSIDVSQWQQ